MIPTVDLTKICNIYVSKKNSGTIVLVIPPEDCAAFMNLIRRGLNTWDYAPPNMKALGDMVEHDRVLQNYWEQDSSK